MKELSINENKTLIIVDPDYVKEGFVDEYTGECLLIDVGKSERWKVSELNELKNLMDLESFVESIEDAYYGFYDRPNVENQIKLENLITQRKTVGRFCNDSSHVGVYILEDILKENPKILTDYGNWCYTIINDFAGTISVYEDQRGQQHFLGVGNKTFYTNTVSWL